MKGPALFQGQIITKIHRQYLNIFFYRTTGAISTKFGTKLPWMMGIQGFSNVGPALFSRGDNYEIAKIIH